MFSALTNHTLAIEYHVDIWQVLPQLRCGDTLQIWTWLEKYNMYFGHVEKFAYGEINERSFSNPHPRSMTRMSTKNCQIVDNNQHVLNPQQKLTTDRGSIGVT